MRVKTARSWTRCLIYWCASLAQRPGGSAIVRSLGDTLLVLLLRMLLGEQQPPGGLLRLMSDERLMPAVLAVMATPEQPWTLESMAARAFLSRATFARHLPASIT